MRVFRTIVLLAVAAFFIPSPPEDRLGMSAQNEDPPATEFLAAAVSTVADLGDFCSRQASVCETAHYLAVKLEGKAKYGIELLYQWANESNGMAMLVEVHDSDGVATGSFAAASGAAEIPGQNTLRLEDLIPEWRAPKANQG